MTINNLPNKNEIGEYVIYRRVNNELWYWGSYNDRNTANEVALAEGCECVAREYVDC